MRGARRGTFPSRPPYSCRGVEFFPRGRENNRTPRDFTTSKLRFERSPPDYARSKRDGTNDRRNDFGGRTASSISYRDERGSQYNGRNRLEHLIDNRDFGLPGPSNDFPILSDERAPPNERGRYKYLSEKWYNDYKSNPPSGPNLQLSFYRERERSRETKEPRNGYGNRGSMRDNERFGGVKAALSGSDNTNMSKYGYVNTSIAKETRELEQRMAEIQRELDMLEKDKKGRSSPVLRGSRNEERRREETHSPFKPSLSYQRRTLPSEQIRLEEEREYLRKRERELALREEQLSRRERQIQERIHSPRPIRTLPPPRGIGTYPRVRRFEPYQRRQVRTGHERGTNEDLVRLPEKGKVVRTRDVSLKEERRPPPRRKSEKKSHMKKEDALEEDKATIKEEDHGHSEETFAAHFEQTIGPEDLEHYIPPRQRALTMLLSHCDKELLSCEVLKKFGITPTKSEPVNLEGYKDRTCLRTYNPTTFGPLDQFAPLRAFEEEVVMNSPDATNIKILENLKGVLGFFPRSPAP